MLGRKRLIIFSLVLALALCSLAYIDLGLLSKSAEAANLGWGVSRKQGK